MTGVLKQEAKRLLLAYETPGEAHMGRPVSQFLSRSILTEAFGNLPDWLATPLRSAAHDCTRWQLNRAPQDMVGGYCLPRTDSLSEAFIVYRYGETVEDPIYMAHELGHLVSDDLFNAAGFNYSAAPEHIIEIPAFFAQHLMYQFLIHHGPYNLRAAASAHFRMEMRDQLIDIAIGASARDAAAVIDREAGSIVDRFKASMQSWLGDDWSQCSKAVQIAERISDRAIMTETEDMFLHKHATSSIFSLALLAKQKTLSPGARTELLETMFGAKGPYSAEQLLRIVDASAKPQLAALVLEATKVAESECRKASPCPRGAAPGSRVCHDAPFPIPS
ncbi:MAG: hypothetical protein K2X41_01585 [Hyphomicrobium sp.]|nr:hypothetical protein [Hyphomicrobium sp.]